MAADDRGGKGLLAVYSVPRPTKGPKPASVTCPIVDFNDAVFVLKTMAPVSKDNYMGHYATVQFDEGHWRLEAEPTDTGVFDQAANALRPRAIVASPLLALPKKRAAFALPQFPSGASADEGGPAETRRTPNDPKRARRQSHHIAEVRMAAQP